MVKGLLKEINKLNALPFYSEKEEFLDKLFSYLYLRFKFKKILLKSLTDLKLSLAQREKMEKIFFIEIKDEGIKRLSKKTFDRIDRVYLDYEDKEETGIIEITLNRVPDIFECSQHLKFFLKYLRSYINKNLDQIQWLESLLKKQEKEQVREVVVEKIVEANPQKESLPGSYLHVNPKKLPENINLIKIIEGIEKKYIKEVLRRTQGNKSNAAKHLGITERMIGYKIKKLNIN